MADHRAVAPSLSQPPLRAACDGEPHALAEPRVHGGLDARALSARGIAAEDLVDFSVNVNPYGPCEAVLEAARTAPLDRYPDPAAFAARSAWARALGCPVEQVAVGHGAADLFWAIARALIAPGQRVVIAEPTFSEFRVAAAAAGAVLTRVYAPASEAHALDLDALAEAGRDAVALYLCAPNNPTGEYVSPSRVRALAAALPETCIVLDQSFLALSDHAHDALAALPDNVLRVRSLTKELGCPGLRIGLCVGAPERMRRIEAMRPTWATSSPALAALEVSARRHAFVEESWQRMRADREAVRALLSARGFTPLASATSYQLVPLDEPAAGLCERLLRHGIQLRDCSSFGLPQHVRVAALPAAARARLAHALDAVRSA
jgi:histidinol-phosphate/aromatic aminotransferase/cobyric acid decarboxylase-like protein